MDICLIMGINSVEDEFATFPVADAVVFQYEYRRESNPNSDVKHHMLAQKEGRQMYISPARVIWGRSAYNALFLSNNSSMAWAELTTSIERPNTERLKTGPRI